MEFVKWLWSCGWKGCDSARWQWKCLQIAGQCSLCLCWKCETNCVPEWCLMTFSVLSWWICSFIKPLALFGYWSLLASWKLYWHCCEYRAWESGVALISLPSAALVFHCHEQLGDWILSWIGSLMWQQSDLWRCWWADDWVWYMSGSQWACVCWSALHCFWRHLFFFKICVYTSIK